MVTDILEATTALDCAVARIPEIVDVHTQTAVVVLKHS
jgi:hypothetical protein